MREDDCCATWKKDATPASALPLCNQEQVWWHKKKDICVLMTEKAQQGMDSIELHKKMIEVRHGSNDMHFLKDVIQIQFSLHEPKTRQNT